MRLSNITALIRNDLTLISKAKWRLVEIIYFPIFNTLIWGFFALASRENALEAGLIVLVVNLFWTYSLLAQQQANMLVMGDLWSLSIKHIITAGMTSTEYLIAKLTTSSIAAILVSSFLLFVAHSFGAPLLAQLPEVIALAVVALLGSLALASAISGTVLMLGREYSFLSWSSLEFFIFFSAPFYDASVLPLPLQHVTNIMPFTRVFSSARAIATNTPISSETLVSAALVALAYFAIAIIYYHLAFRRAKRSGVLARISG